MKKDRSPKKADLITATAVQDFKDLSTDDIKRERDLFLCELRSLQQSLDEMQAKANHIRHRQKELLAKVEGLSTILGCR